MTHEERKKLEFIKSDIKEGRYRILPCEQWDKFSRDLAGAGASLLRDIEEQRQTARALRVSLFFFTVKRRVMGLESSYGELAQDYDLFFDAGMRWLESITNHNEYREDQVLQKKYVESLLDHCSRALDHVGNVVYSKRNDYHHYQILCWAAIAVLVAIISVIIK